MVVSIRHGVEKEMKVRGGWLWLKRDRRERKDYNMELNTKNPCILPYNDLFNPFSNFTLLICWPIKSQSCSVVDGIEVQFYVRQTIPAMNVPTSPDIPHPRLFYTHHSFSNLGG